MLENKRIHQSGKMNDHLFNNLVRGMKSRKWSVTQHISPVSSPFPRYSLNVFNKKHVPAIFIEMDVAELSGFSKFIVKYKRSKYWRGRKIWEMEEESREVGLAPDLICFTWWE